MRSPLTMILVFDNVYDNSGIDWCVREIEKSLKGLQAQSLFPSTAIIALREDEYDALRKSVSSGKPPGTMEA